MAEQFLRSWWFGGNKGWRLRQAFIYQCHDDMATSVISNPEIARDMTSLIEWNSGIPIDLTYTFFIKVGRIVIFQMRFTGTVNQGTDIAPVPTELMPRQAQCWFPAFHGDGGTTAVPRTMITQTTIRAIGQLSNKYYIWGAYVT